MQKIIIKNFRAIEYAEIELKKVLVLIGAQASGKSTIAKLIYFFKTIQDDFFVQVYESGNTDLEKLVRRKFIEFFGLVKDDFEVEFWFDLDINKKIILRNENKKIRVYLNDFRNPDLKEISENVEKITEFKNKKGIVNKNNHKSLDDDYLDELISQTNLSHLMEMFFSERRKDNLYVIAGRNVTVSYSNIFTDYLKSKIKEELSYGLESKLKGINSTDEQLMLQYIRTVNYIKEFFKDNKTFEELIEEDYDSGDWEEKVRGNNTEQLDKYVSHTYQILRAKYQFTNNEELLLENGKSISLSDASSGQQEVIRILQDLFLAILYENRFLRIIEEPEAHLFPIAQKELIELLALAVNYQPENQLIIATHSPYILSVFNNLLFANEVATKDESLQGEVSEIIDKDFWLKAEDFSAYTLGGEEAYCESIMSDDRAMIDQNYLDEVSEMLGMEFNALLELYRSTFKSKRR